MNIHYFILEYFYLVPLLPQNFTFVFWVLVFDTVTLFLVVHDNISLISVTYMVSCKIKVCYMVLLHPYIVQNWHINFIITAKLHLVNHPEITDPVTTQIPLWCWSPYIRKISNLFHIYYHGTCWLNKSCKLPSVIHT
jgi:hypothetical protein